jgi:hypothetical protein
VPPWGTWSKKSTLRPASIGHASREKAEGSKQRKKRESPVRTTEDAEILLSTVVDKPQGALSLVAPGRRLSSVVVASRG